MIGRPAPPPESPADRAPRPPSGEELDLARREIAVAQQLIERRRHRVKSRQPWTATAQRVWTEREMLIAGYEPTSPVERRQFRRRLRSAPVGCADAELRARLEHGRREAVRRRSAPLAGAATRRRARGRQPRPAPSRRRGSRRGSSSTSSSSRGDPDDGDSDLDDPHPEGAARRRGAPFEHARLGRMNGALVRFLRGRP